VQHFTRKRDTKVTIKVEIEAESVSGIGIDDLPSTLMDGVHLCIAEGESGKVGLIPGEQALEQVRRLGHLHARLVDGRLYISSRRAS
jgi:hypothetical protein